jgi:UDP:flavonoid glycosyltransferase YjiC (YdhE family)
MTRVLFTCWPFEGHVFPQLSIATALREGGDPVAFYSGEGALGAVEGEGMQLFPFRRTEGAWLRVHERERAVGGRRQSLRVQREAFRDWLVESISDQVADLHDVIETFEPDVIVTDASMWGPSLVLHEAASVPVALGSPLIYALVPGPGAPPPGSRLKPARTARGRALAWAVTRATDLLATGTRRRVDEIRADHGLPPLRGSVNEHMGGLPLYLVGSIPELDFRRRDLPPSVHYVGPLLWHPPQTPGSAQWLDALPAARPWVHVTEGTSHYQDPFVLRAAASGLAGAPYEAILTTGRRRSPADVPPGAPNVHVRDWLSHDVLLPRCAALVTTGGAGTTMAGLRAGVPLVIVPTTWDKPDIAGRIVDAGVGVRLAPRRCTPQRLRAAVDEVLADPRYAVRAREVAAGLAAAPGPEGAAELVRALAPTPVTDRSVPQ